MIRTRLKSRPIAVAAVAGLGGAAILVGAPTAMAGSTAAAQTATTTPATVADACHFTQLGETFKVRIVLTLRSASDNDITAIKVRTTDNDEKFSFDNNDVRMKSIAITTTQTSGALTVKRNYTGTTSPTVLNLSTTTGAEITRVATTTTFRMHGSTVLAKCNISLSN